MFNTESVSNMAWAFSYCIQLEHLDLSSFKLRKDCNLWCLFQDCHNLKTINLSSFHTFDDILSHCFSLKQVIIKKKYYKKATQALINSLQLKSLDYIDIVAVE